MAFHWRCYKFICHNLLYAALLAYLYMPSWPHTDSATASRSYAPFCFAWSSYGGPDVDGIGRGWEGKKNGGTETLPFAESFGSATITVPVVQGTCEKNFCVASAHSVTRKRNTFLVRRKSENIAHELSRFHIKFSGNYPKRSSTSCCWKITYPKSYVNPSVFFRVLGLKSNSKFHV